MDGQNKMEKTDKTTEAIKTVIRMLKPNNTDFISTQAGTVIKTVPNDGMLLMDFIQAVDDKSFHKWRMFKTVLAGLVGEGFKGRCGAPIKKRLPRHDQSFLLGSAYVREKTGVGYIQQIPLHKCITIKQKINMIMATDVSRQIKSDLISGLNFNK